MINISDVQKSLAYSIMDSVDFNSIINNISGHQISIVLDSSVMYEFNVVPYVSINQLSSTVDVDDDSDEFIIQTILSIKASNEHVEENGIMVSSDVVNLNILSNMIVKDFENYLSCSGINENFSIILSGYNVITTEVGEADDIQSIITMKIKDKKFI